MQAGEKPINRRRMDNLPDYGCKCPHYHNSTKVLMHDQWERMPTCPPDFKQHCCHPRNAKDRGTCLQYDEKPEIRELAKQIAKKRLTASQGMFQPPDNEEEMLAECAFCKAVDSCATFFKLTHPVGDKQYACKRCFNKQDKDIRNLQWPPTPRKWKAGVQTFKMLATQNRRYYSQRYESVRILSEQAFRADELVRSVVDPTSRDVGEEAKTKIQCFHCSYLFPRRCIAGQVPNQIPDDYTKDPMFCRLREVEAVFECWNCYYLRMSHWEWLKVQSARQEEALVRFGQALEQKSLLEEQLEEESEVQQITRPPTPINKPIDCPIEEPAEELVQWLDSLLTDSYPPYSSDDSDDLAMVEQWTAVGEGGDLFVSVTN